MRSLRAKLILAFLVISVAGVALGAVFVRQFVTREFDDYVLKQARAFFVDEARAYYETNGSWEGIERLQHWRIGSQIPGQPPNGSQRVMFGLVDPAGVILVPFDKRPVGAVVNQQDMAGGTPVTVDGQTIAVAIASGPLAERNATERMYLARTDMALGGAAVVMVVVALVLGAVLAQVITRPVRELTAAAAKITGGELDQRVPVRSRDELGTLANQFNRMSADLWRATLSRRQMTADIAHDLRTPLTVIGGYMEALRDQVLKPTPERFAIIYDEIQLLQRLVDDLHTLSLADVGELHLDLQIVPPQQLVARVADAFRDAAAKRGVALQTRIDPALPDVRVDVEHMARVLGNLVSNALRYTPPGGQVTLSAATQPGVVRLDVSDTGAGIPPEHLDSVFERFYRADAARGEETGGSGLGLAIAKSIVEAHGGQITVESTVGQGSTFAIDLPQYRP